jgi:hypothetical protein
VEKINDCNDLRVKKILQDALRKAGNYSALHRELIKLGAEVSVPAIRKAIELEEGPQRMKLDILAALVLYLDLDWKRVGEQIEREYLKK